MQLTRIEVGWGDKKNVLEYQTVERCKAHIMITVLVLQH